MAKKEPEFVVSDRRRFAPEGEIRPDVPPSEQDQPATRDTATPAVASTVAPQSASQPDAAEQAEAGSEENEVPVPPTAEEQHQQNEAYKESSKKLEQIFGPAPKGSAAEMTFERVIESFYMSALIQLGAIRQEGETPRVDIIGARQTIDSLSILQEKTKGNLTDREQTLMQNVLFELRMAWIEITNAIASGPPPKAPGAAFDKK